MDKHEQRAREIVNSAAISFGGNTFAERVTERTSLTMDITQALREAEAEALERAAKVLCEHCADGDVPMNYGEPFDCAHKHVEQGRFPSYSTCKAADIRALEGQTP